MYILPFLLLRMKYPTITLNSFYDELQSQSFHGPCTIHKLFTIDNDDDYDNNKGHGP